MAEGKKLRKASYVKVAELAPETHGHNLVVKVISISPMTEKKRYDRSVTKIMEAVVGDETGVVTLTARDEQTNFLKEGNIVVIRNSNADVVNGYLRLNVTKWGKIAEFPDGIASTPPAPEVIKKDNDLSSVEYELVTVEDSDEEEQTK